MEGAGSTVCRAIFSVKPGTATQPRKGRSMANRFAARRAVAKGRQAERRVTPQHGFGMVDEVPQRGVERPIAAVLAHDPGGGPGWGRLERLRSEEHKSELQSPCNL